MSDLRLKEYRKALKLSQRNVSDALNISQGLYWKWEVGRTFPNSNQIIQLCEIFNCTPNDLFGIKGVVKIVQSSMRED